MKKIQVKIKYDKIKILSAPKLIPNNPAVEFKYAVLGSYSISPEIKIFF